MTQNRPATHFAFLDGMRGFAALYVVLHHCLAWLAPPLPRWANFFALPFKFGHSAVSVFIVLSGFSLMLPIALDAEHQFRGGKRGFFQRRARRILPPYYAALILSSAALILQDWFYNTTTPQVRPYLTGNSATNRALDIFSHFLLIQNLSPRWLGSINVTFWSIATESQLYFTLPFLLVPMWKRYGWVAMVGVGVLFAFVIPLSLPTLSGACFWYLALFAFGTAAATFVPKVLDSSATDSARRGSYLAITVLAVLYLAVSLPITERTLSGLPGTSASHDIVLASLRDIALGGCVAAFVLLGVVYRIGQPVKDQQRKSVFSFVIVSLESRLGNLLSRFSYSLYLTHFVVLDTVERYGATNGWSSQHTWYWRAFFCVPASILFGYGFYLLFERPFLTRGKGSVGKRDVAPTGTGLATS